MSEALDELAAAFAAYEAALIANDVAALDGFFLDSDSTIRFGVAEEQYGYPAIEEWRRTATPVPTDRRLVRHDIIVLTPDTAVIACEFAQGSDRETGRQSQVWVRTDEGWLIAHAHVSVVSKR
jgi:ketosteroid isomerase-like protein